MAQPPPEIPPQQYGSYYRPSQFSGSSVKLEALAKGYFGLTTAFIVNIAIVIAVRIVLSSSAATMTQGSYVTALIIAIGVVFVVITLLTYPSNKQVGIGMGWASSTPAWVSLLMGLNSALCCGIIGYVVVQSIAASEMNKYGVKGGAFRGVKKKEVAAAIADLKQQEAQGVSSQQAPPA